MGVKFSQIVHETVAKGGLNRESGAVDTVTKGEQE